MSFKAVTRIEETKPSRREYMLAGLATLVVISLVGGLIHLKMTSPASRSISDPRLTEALRAGAPEFEGLRERILVEDLVATKSARAMGDVTMELTATVRNETGRSISALEVRGAVADAEGQTISERTVVVMPAGRAKLLPDERVNVHVVLEGFDSQVEQANVLMEIVGVRFD